MSTRRAATLQRQIDKTKLELSAIGDMRPGSLSTQYNVCGKAGCRCKATPPEKHGPYYQVSYTRKGKSSSKFVTVKAQPREDEHRPPAQSRIFFKAAGPDPSKSAANQALAVA